MEAGAPYVDPSTSAFCPTARPLSIVDRQADRSIYRSLVCLASIGRRRRPDPPRHAVLLRGGARLPPRLRPFRRRRRPRSSRRPRRRRRYFFYGIDYGFGFGGGQVDGAGHQPSGGFQGTHSLAPLRGSISSEDRPECRLVDALLVHATPGRKKGTPFSLMILAPACPCPPLIMV